MPGGSDLLRVNFAALDDGCMTINGFCGAMDDRLSSLERTLESRMESWSGDARQSYVNEKVIWNGCADRIKTLLHSVSGGVGESRELMSMTENNCKNMYIA